MHYREYSQDFAEQFAANLAGDTNSDGYFDPMCLILDVQEDWSAQTEEYPSGVDWDGVTYGTQSFGLYTYEARGFEYEGNGFKIKARFKHPIEFAYRVEDGDSREDFEPLKDEIKAIMPGWF